MYVSCRHYIPFDEEDDEDPPAVAAARLPAVAPPSVAGNETEGRRPYLYRTG